MFEPTDEDDKWLYGDGTGEENLADSSKHNEDEEEGVSQPPPEMDKNEMLQPPEIRADEDKELNTSRETGEITDDREAKENGEIEDEEEEEEEEDSDEDNVNVIIGDINKTAPTYTNINIAKRGPTMPTQAIKAQGKFSIEEFETVGTINGVPAHEFNLDGLEDKPWRIPGADITDYFNYGFNEETWKAYCERQKRIRVHESCTGLPVQTLSNQQWPNTQGTTSTSYPSSQTSTFQSNKKPGWEAGQIRVIGSGVASRRMDESGQENQNIQVLPPNSDFGGMPHSTMIPPVMPPMEIPPPGFNPTGDPYGAPPPTGEYFNPEPEYFPSYEPTAADQWRDGWAPGTLVTPGQSVKTVHSHLDDGSQDRESRERSRDQSRDDRSRSRDLDRDEKDKRKDRTHRNRSRSKSHERKRNKSRSRSPSHKKHKKKSKKSDKKRRSEEKE